VGARCHDILYTWEFFSLRDNRQPKSELFAFLGVPVFYQMVEVLYIPAHRDHPFSRRCQSVLKVPTSGPSARSSPYKILRYLYEWYLRQDSENIHLSLADRIQFSFLRFVNRIQSALP